jgi:hypothetical protein
LLAVVAVVLALSQHQTVVVVVLVVIATLYLVKQLVVEVQPKLQCQSLKALLTR